MGGKLNRIRSFLAAQMEDNKSLLEYLPKEILYYFARFIDLRDLGALLFTSKQINALLQTDLAFQKIVCDATP